MDKTYYAFTPHVDKITWEGAMLEGWTKKQWRKHSTARAAIAMEKVGDFIHYGVSVCSEGDSFNRKVGRTLAEERMKEGYGVFPIKSGISSRFKGNEKGMMLYYLNAMTYAIAEKIRTAQRKIGESPFGKNRPQVVGTI